ncbi:hypothetical protein [uncultured Paludibaculum sp.]|uniref:hypothetical protein n=1 Tax=uncultured Paludibaculum sp. TaxID=1765020 RepID=UPI002AAB7525|nr:hypothetical protein [uncultured Paludibaculum sp.]
MNLSGLLAVLFCGATIAAPLPVDPQQGLIAYWPDASEKVVGLLKELGVKTLITTTPVTGMASLFDATAADSIEGLTAAVDQARKAGFLGAAVSAVGEAAAFQAFLKGQSGFVAIVYLKPEQIGWDVAPALAVLRSGTWPGIAPRDTSAAGATEAVWLNANASLVAHLRALYPNRPAVLGYRPDKDAGVPETRSLPPRAMEVVLADAFAAGGYAVLSFPENFRRGLLAGETRMTSSWRDLVQLASFQASHREVVQKEGYARTLVIAGDLEQSGEILNLAYRRNLCPRVAAASRVPALSTATTDVVVAANVPLANPVIANLKAFASAGGTVMAAPAEDDKTPWWTSSGKKVEPEEEWDKYAVGRGVVYGYRGPVLDPGTFALDLKDAYAEKSGGAGGPKNLDVRLWAADTIQAVMHRIGPGRLAVVLTSYGNPPNHDFLLSVRGRYRSAWLEDPSQTGKQPLTLMPRDGRMEINLKRAGRTAIIYLEELGR